MAAVAFAWRAAVPGRRAVLAVAGLGVAAGFLAVPWSLAVFAGVQRTSVLFAVDGICGIVMATALSWGTQRRGGEAGPADRVSVMAAVVSAALLAVSASIAVASFVAASAVAPHGEWDAWAQWNLRGRFFFRGLGDGTWRVAYDPVLAWSHPDYPPLIPASVARIWTYAGRESVAGPMALAALFGGVTVLTAGLSVWRTRGVARGCLAAAAILATPSFVRWAPSQGADIALAFFMLAAFVLWQEECPATAGLAAGLAAWTKNEGQVFLVVFLVVVACAETLRDRARAVPRLLRVAAGAAPAVLAVAWFKLAIAPASYFVAGQTFSDSVGRAMDIGRAEFVARSLGRELWRNGSSIVGVLPILAGFALIRGVSRRAPAASGWGAAAAVAMAIVYFLAYLVTPLDLGWQLRTSVDRLVLQLVPLTAWALLSLAD